jgi:hypothetical protein
MVEEQVPERDSRLRAVLIRLKDAGADASAIIRRDGVMIESDLQAGRDERDSFAAMAAAMLGAAETATSELKQGVPRRVIMEIGDRKIIEVGAGPVALLVVTMGSGVQFNRVLREIDRAAQDIRGIVKGAPLE